MIKPTFPDARTAYEIPNAMVGYQPGYGEAADCWPQGANSSYMRMRVLVMVAVKNDLALVAAAVGPYHRSVRTSARQAVGREPPNRLGHGQVRQQLFLARRPATVIAMLTLTNVINCWCTSSDDRQVPARGSLRSRGAATVSA